MTDNHDVSGREVAIVPVDDTDSLLELLPQFLKPSRNAKAKVSWRGQNAGGAKPARGTAIKLTSRRELKSMLGPNGLAFMEEWKLDRSAAPVIGFTGGTTAGMRRLKTFVRHGLAAYPKERNHPEHEGTSRLSPYLDFGHLGPLTVAQFGGGVTRHRNLQLRAEVEQSLGSYGPVEMAVQLGLRQPHEQLTRYRGRRRATRQLDEPRQTPERCRADPDARLRRECGGAPDETRPAPHRGG